MQTFQLKHGAGIVRMPRPTTMRTPRGIVEYVADGQGTPLLSLHGGLGGYDQGLLLARSVLTNPIGFRVIAVSRPGYLGTPLTSGQTPEEQADLYAGLLDCLNASRAFVVAVSGGGPSALHFALRHPDRCAGLILVSACTGHLDLPAEATPTRLLLMRCLARFTPFCAMMRWRIARHPDRAVRSIRDQAVLDRTLRHPEAGPLMRALQLSVWEQAAKRWPGLLNDMDRFSAMRSISVAELVCPVLAVHGTDDKVVSFTHSKRLAETASGVELLALEGGGHGSLFTHLDEIRAEVRLFFERQPAGV